LWENVNVLSFNFAFSFAAQHTVSFLSTLSLSTCFLLRIYLIVVTPTSITSVFIVGPCIMEFKYCSFTNNCNFY